MRSICLIVLVAVAYLALVQESQAAQEKKNARKIEPLSILKSLGSRATRKLQSKDKLGRLNLFRKATKPGTPDAGKTEKPTVVSSTTSQQASVQTKATPTGKTTSSSSSKSTKTTSKSVEKASDSAVEATKQSKLQVPKNLETKPEIDVGAEASGRGDVSIGDAVANKIEKDLEENRSDLPEQAKGQIAAKVVKTQQEAVKNEAENADEKARESSKSDQKTANLPADAMEKELQPNEIDVPKAAEDKIESAVANEEKFEEVAEPELGQAAVSAIEAAGVDVPENSETQLEEVVEEAFEKALDFGKSGKEAAKMGADAAQKSLKSKGIDISETIKDKVEAAIEKQVDQVEDLADSISADGGHERDESQIGEVAVKAVEAAGLDLPEKLEKVAEEAAEEALEYALDSGETEAEAAKSAANVVEKTLELNGIDVSEKVENKIELAIKNEAEKEAEMDQVEDLADEESGKLADEVDDSADMTVSQDVGGVEKEASEKVPKSDESQNEPANDTPKKESESKRSNVKGDRVRNAAEEEEHKFEDLTDSKADAAEHKTNHSQNVQKSAESSELDESDAENEIEKPKGKQVASKEQNEQEKPVKSS